jgi:competence protein ComEC
MKRPLVPIALLFAGGILLGDHFVLRFPVLLCSAFALFVLALVWSACRRFVLYPLILLAGWIAMLVSSVSISPHDLRTLVGSEPRLATIRATIIETPSIRSREKPTGEAFRTLARAEVSEIQIAKEGWQPAHGKIVIGTTGALTNVFAGQTVEIAGVISKPKPAFVDGLFDYRAYLERHGIYYQLQAASEGDWQMLSSPAHSPLADRFRDWARQKLALGLPREDESLRLEWALTLGWKPALTEEVEEPFVRAATYHIFAVDGLRMAIVFGIFFGLFRALRIPRAISGMSLVPIIWFYVALTGWPASAIRASVMLTIVIAGWSLKRPSDLINSLFAAAIIILAWDPQQLFEAGFQLSFFVVLALILIIPVLQGSMKRALAPDPLLPAPLRRQWPGIVRVPTKYVWEIWLTSFAAWIGSLPLVAYYFNIFTPVSTPANLVAVPACALVLISNLASLLLAGWFPAAAELFNHAGWALMELIRVSSDWFARWPAGYCYVSAPSWTTTALYYLLLIAAFTGWLFVAPGRVWKWTGAALLICLWSWQTLQRAAVTELTILPEGGSAAIFLDGPGTSGDMLIDCGSASSFQFSTKPFLRSRGVNRLPNFVISHGDTRHGGGAELLAELFNIQTAWTSPVHFRSPAYRTAIATFSDPPGKLKIVASGDRLLNWTALHPSSEDHFSQGEDNAMALLGQFGPTRVLLLSDLGRSGQSALLQRHPDLKTDILVCGLPSHSEPLSDALLTQLHPQLIIITDAEFPASARAPSKLRDRLSTNSAPVVYTRSCGSIIIEFTKTGWSLRTMDGHRYPPRT